MNYTIDGQNRPFIYLFKGYTDIKITIDCRIAGCTQNMYFRGKIIKDNRKQNITSRALSKTERSVIDL